MKNVKKLALVLMSLTLLTACNSQEIDKNAKLQTTMQKSKEVNKIDFEEMKIQDLKPSIKNIFGSKKNYKGYLTYKDEDGYWYIGIFAGKKNTGGYSIKVLSVEEKEGKTEIVVQETRPKPSGYVTQALTYPYTVIRTKGIDNNPVVVKNTSGEEFKDIRNLGNLR